MYLWVHAQHQFATGRFQDRFATLGAVIDIKIDGLVEVVGQLINGLAFKADVGVAR